MTARFGNYQLDEHEILERAKLYLARTDGPLFAYPFYDELVTNNDRARLADGDLLAPTLLNAAPKIVAYAGLQRRRAELEQKLAVLPDLDLADADDGVLDGVARLFRVLDTDGGIRQAGGTTLSKVLHRKQPRLIPLYDSKVWSCYVGVDGTPIPRERRREWEPFIRLLLHEMRSDIHRNAALLAYVQALASSHPITELRALDIVVWQGTSAATAPLEPEDE